VQFTHINRYLPLTRLLTSLRYFNYLIKKHFQYIFHEIFRLIFQAKIYEILQH